MFTGGRAIPSRPQPPAKRTASSEEKSSFRRRLRPARNRASAGENIALALRQRLRQVDALECAVLEAERHGALSDFLIALTVCRVVTSSATLPRNRAGLVQRLRSNGPIDTPERLCLIASWLLLALTRAVPLVAA